MADGKEYVLGNNARDLLKFTNAITKPRSDEVSARDVRIIFQKIAALEDIRDVRTVCNEAIQFIDRKTKEGFTKRAYNDYGKDMRQMCKNIIRYIQGANGKQFETEYDERLKMIGEALDECSLMANYTNSPLATVTMISPNRNSPRNHAIDTITIHCFVGQVTARLGCEIFQPTSKKASCNYVVGKDGDIGLCVEEKDRSWCTSNGTNDNRAVTIEVASDAIEPYAVTAKAYAALLDLVTDICRRNGIKKLVWSTNKNERMNHLNGCNMTVHRDYANKSCPGAYLYERHGAIAAEVNKRLGATGGTTSGTSTPAAKDNLYRVRKTWADAVSQIGAYTLLENAKRSADAHPGYSVFDSTGKVVYPVAAFSPYTVRVTISDLYIRGGPGTGYAKKGFIAPGVYTIIEESAGTGSTAGWGRLKSGAGWISLDYCKKL